MKNLVPIVILLFLFLQTNGYCQTEQTTPIPVKQDTTLKKESLKTAIDPNKFIGTYLLVEGDFELEIVAEDNKMYIISPFSKDILIASNETTLHELTRGVDLELIAGNSNDLKFTQNGYETVIKRVKPRTEE
jgi:hypothetical protein